MTPNPALLLSTSVGNDAFEQANQVITSIDVTVDAASTAPGYFVATPTVSFQAGFLMLNTRPGVFGRFVSKVTATDSAIVIINFARRLISDRVFALEFRLFYLRQIIQSCRSELGGFGICTSV